MKKETVFFSKEVLGKSIIAVIISVFCLSIVFPTTAVTRVEEDVIIVNKFCNYRYYKFPDYKEIFCSKDVTGEVGDTIKVKFKAKDIPFRHDDPIVTIIQNEKQAFFLGSLLVLTIGFGLLCAVYDFRSISLIIFNAMNLIGFVITLLLYFL